MRISPKTMGIVYFLLGILFTYVAILSADETIWNFVTVLLAFFATLDFGVGIRMFIIHSKIKKNNKKK
ncbi:YdiK family protein [Lentibacillus sp.]|uniref:YdiK family protein n=1 Tax=Lentibacillus sp. TaxID=1925746 RepID=UPI002B4B4E18|nr:YdiK family protein [Lentibacillus sp.]HLS09840.1 YdiK family protein [Lentibacillus sp.]